jgi:hypothetical protein
MICVKLSTCTLIYIYIWTIVDICYSPNFIIFDFFNQVAMLVGTKI